MIDQYDFNFDNAAIFYIFDRDDHSNTNRELIESLLSKLVNSRDNLDFDRQGLLLLSYPSIESFTLSCFYDKAYSVAYETGTELKNHLDTLTINHQKIDKAALEHAAFELLYALGEINGCTYSLDDFSECNLDVFHHEEMYKAQNSVFKCISLLIICLLDLGLLELQQQEDESADT